MKTTRILTTEKFIPELEQILINALYEHPFLINYDCSETIFVDEYHKLGNGYGTYIQGIRISIGVRYFKYQISHHNEDAFLAYKEDYSYDEEYRQKAVSICADVIERYIDDIASDIVDYIIEEEKEEE